MEKEVVGFISGVAVTLAAAFIMKITDVAAWFVTRRKREIQFDKEQLMDWRKFIIQHSFEGACRSAAANYLKRQWNNEQRPYRHQDVRSAFPVEKLIDPASDL